jgi:GNAT superfamily N-acetyltransferase
MSVPSDAALDRFLTAWLGAWPPPGDGSLAVVASDRRLKPGWDGRVQPLLGVLAPAGGVLSVPPDFADAVSALAATRSPDELLTDLPLLAASVGVPDGHVINGVFRWTSRPAVLPDAGVWLDAEDPAVPEWLKPFGGEVLVALEEGRYAAGVGLKRHDPSGVELAVGTEPGARGRGLARRLVSQAAQSVVAQGAVVTYLHAADNVPSGRVADAAGMPDRGWRILALLPTS